MFRVGVLKVAGITGVAYLSLLCAAALMLVALRKDATSKGVSRISVKYPGGTLASARAAVAAGYITEHDLRPGSQYFVFDLERVDLDHNPRVLRATVSRSAGASVGVTG